MARCIPAALLVSAAFTCPAAAAPASAPLTIAEYMMTTIDVIPQDTVLKWGREVGMSIPDGPIPPERLREVAKPVYERIAKEYLSSVVLPQNAPDVGIKVTVKPPRVVMMAPVGDRVWGHYMWPTVYRLRDGRIIVRVVYGDDAAPVYQRNKYYYYVSQDDGRNWMHVQAADPNTERPVSDIGYRLPDGSEIRYNDRFIDIQDLGIKTYLNSGFYRLGDLPERSRSVPFFRRSALQTSWVEDKASWNPDMLVPAYEVEAADGKRTLRIHLPEPFTTGMDSWVAEMYTLSDGSVLHSYENARHMRMVQDVGADGKLGAPPASHLWRSRDGGHNWDFAGRVPDSSFGPFFQAGRAHLEPRMPNGNWVAFIRTPGADGSTHGGPLMIRISTDQGKSWSEALPIRPCSVNPLGLMLDNKIAVRQYGRPGLFLMFCADGEGKIWGSDVTVIPPWTHHTGENTCCNGRMLALGPDRFLLVYTRWDYGDPWGQKRKAVLAQEFVVNKAR